MDSSQNITLMNNAGAPSRRMQQAARYGAAADEGPAPAGDDFQKSAPVKKGPTPGNISAALNESTSFKALSSQQASAMLLDQDRDIIDLKKVWDFETGGRVYSTGLAGPDGTLYMGSDDGHLYALRDGVKLWEFKAGDGVRSKPVLDEDGVLYFGSLDRNLYAVRDGKEQWHFETQGPIYGSPLRGPDGTLYIGTNSGDFHAVKDGKELWSFKARGQIQGTPALGPDGTVYFGSYDSTVYAVKDGKEKWHCRLQNWVESSVILDADGTVYAQSGCAIAAIKDGSVLWEYRESGNFSDPQLGPDGVIYAGNLNGNLYALKDGKKLWDFNSRENWMDTLGCIRAEPVIGPDGTIYFGAEDNKVCAVRNGKKVWDYKTGGEIIGAPTLGSDGILYVGSGDNKIYALKDMTLSEKAGRLARKAPPQKDPGQKVEEEDGWLIVGGVKLPVNQAISHLAGTAKGVRY
jgi:outer membrane protein assembly factor BamB